MSDVEGVIAEAILALRSSGRHGVASGLDRVLALLRGNRPVAWAVSWSEGGTERLQAFQRKDVALSWLDDRRACNADLEGALVFPVFRTPAGEGDAPDG
ncbi:hypothetical protein ACWIEX_00165 [Bosea sp. NPDC055353]